MGDLAMLQVSLRRLHQLWPHARILVFTADPAALQVHFPNVIPAFSDARDLWLGASRHTRLGTFIWRHWPSLYKRILTSKSHPGRMTRAMLEHFLRDLRNTDLFVISGMGSFTSAFEPAIFNMLKTIPLMRSLGIPVVAFSQGIGPIDPSSATWPIAQQSLRLIDFIAVREGVFGPSLLRRLGVPEERIVVTGDDSIEVAYRDQPAAPGTFLGANLRVAGYSGLERGHSQSLAHTISDIATSLGTQFLPIPISHVPEECDLATYSSLFSADGSEELTNIEKTTDWVFQQVSKCRVVITGSYHGAVFALSQGVPAVCLWNSEYYRYKFVGLATQFGQACRVMGLDQPDFTAALLDATRELWANYLVYRKPLLKAARNQIEASKAAWAELPFRIPQTKAAAEAQDYGRESADRVYAWYRHRTEKLASDLRQTAAYLQEVEQARDWHAERANRLQAELTEMKNTVCNNEEDRAFGQSTGHI